MTHDWELYFAAIEGHDDHLERIDVEVDDDLLAVLRVATYLLGFHAVEEFMMAVVVEHLDALESTLQLGFGSTATIIGKAEAPCFVCEKPTRFVDIHFETMICSAICEWAAWEAYGLALRGRDPWRWQQAA